MSAPALEWDDAVDRRADRAADVLARRGAWLAPSGRGYAVRQGLDGRRRALMTLDEPVFRRLVAAPGLSPRPDGSAGWILAGRQRAGEPRNMPLPAPGRPSVIEGERLVAEADGRLVKRRANLGESPLTWLASRRDADGRPMLDPAEVRAGERLRDEFERCGRLGRLTMSWDSGPRSGGGRGPGAEPAEQARAAKARVRAALLAVEPALRPVVERVCMVGTALQAAEQELGLRRRTARHALKRGLAQLARHYRLG